jgi:hypothetical protein
MRYKFPALIGLSFTLATAEIFKFPLPNGFPNITSAQALQAVEHQAGGPIPSSSTGSGGKLPLQEVQALQALAFNEIMEVAFFTQLLQNISVRIHLFRSIPRPARLMRLS